MVRPRLEELPTEILEQTACPLDKASLLALGSTSRTIRRNFYYVCGERLFKTLKFCLHPHSLQTLTNIASHPFLLQTCSACGLWYGGFRTHRPHSR
jgi:hypothetical protein